MVLLIPNEVARSPAKLFITRWDANCLRLNIELSRRAGCSASAQKIFFHADFPVQQAALRTRFNNGGQLPIRASSSSPARIGPTPEGVPVKMTSPGKSVRFWLAQETMSATE